MNAEPRPQRFFWILGILLLIGTMVGAGWFFKGPGGSSYADSTDRDAASPPPPVTVCTGFVDVLPGVTQLYPLQPGRVLEIAPEGKPVKKGDIVLRLDNRLAQYKVSEAKADLDAAEKQLALAKLLPERHVLKKEQQKAAVEVAKRQREVVFHEYKTKEEIAKTTGSELNKSIRNAYEEMVKKADAALLAEQTKLKELDTFDSQPEVEISKAESDVSAKKARLEQAEYALKECDLRAPSDGTVLRVLANPGEVLGANPRTAAIQFSPESPKNPKIVRAEVLQEFASRVREGQEVTIEDDTFAAATWQGRVNRVSNWFSERRSRIAEPFFVNDVRTLECLIDITSEGGAPLRIGQRVRVKIKQGS